MTAAGALLIFLAAGSNASAGDDTSRIVNLSGSPAEISYCLVKPLIDPPQWTLH